MSNGTSTESPCSRCGVTYGFHICLDMSKEKMQRVVQPKRSATPIEAQNLADGRALRWERFREQNRERDAEIVERYQAGGVGYMKIAEAMGLNGNAVLKVLQRARDAGEITMRPRGVVVDPTKGKANA